MGGGRGNRGGEQVLYPLPRTLAPSLEPSCGELRVLLKVLCLVGATKVVCRALLLARIQAVRVGASAIDQQQAVEVASSSGLPTGYHTGPLGTDYNGPESSRWKRIIRCGCNRPVLCPLQRRNLF